MAETLDEMNARQARENAAAVRAALDALKVHWRAQGAPIAERLAPGLSDEEIDEILTPYGLVLPEEVREVFRWHDGATITHLIDECDADLGIGCWQFFSLGAMVDYYLHEWRDLLELIAAETGNITAEDVWPRHWFPVFRQLDPRKAIVVSFRGTSRHEVRKADSVEGIEGSLAHFSLVSLLETWRMLMDTGCLRWDADRQLWIEDESRAYWHTLRSAFA